MTKKLKIDSLEARSHSHPNNAFCAAQGKLDEVIEALCGIRSDHFGYPADRQRTWLEAARVSCFVNRLVTEVNEENGFDEQ